MHALLNDERHANCPKSDPGKQALIEPSPFAHGAQRVYSFAVEQPEVARARRQHDISNVIDQCVEEFA